MQEKRCHQARINGFENILSLGKSKFRFLISLFIQREKLKIIIFNQTFMLSEIKSIFGQPDYRSVNITFEVEDKTHNRIETGLDDVRKFIIHYCELQSWGEMHRCKSKVIQDNAKDNEK